MSNLTHTPVMVPLSVPDKQRVMVLPREPAAAVAAALVPGGRVSGLTGGQFSLLDLVRAVLAKTGAADVVISTWTAGIRDAETAAWLLAADDIRSLAFIVDRSFPTRQPRYAKRLLELFGPDAFLLTNTHAKFAIVENEQWKVAIRSSMNLNKNTRVEQFDIDDSTEIVAMLRRFVAQLSEAQQAGFDVRRDVVDPAMELALQSEGADDPEEWEEYLPASLRRSRFVVEQAPAAQQSAEGGGYLDVLRELERDAKTAYAVAAEAGSNAAGVAALLRQRHQLAIAVREEMERIASAEAAEVPLTEDEVIAMASADLIDLCKKAPPVFDAVMSLLVEAGCARDIHRTVPPPLRVVG